MDKWILTSEKLPPIGEWVLVTNGKCGGKHCKVMTYKGLKSEKVYTIGVGEREEQYHAWTSGHGDILSENPLAWMPLPKPYEPQESEEKPQEPKEEQWKDFALWVAKEIFVYEWEYNKDAFAEIACRKLSKLGIVVRMGDEWMLVEPQESEEV